jgi:hypothetical protein
LKVGERAGTGAAGAMVLSIWIVPFWAASADGLWTTLSEGAADEEVDAIDRSLSLRSRLFSDAKMTLSVDTVTTTPKNTSSAANVLLRRRADYHRLCHLARNNVTNERF